MQDKALRISGVVDDSIVDGPGMRYTVFVQGCPHGCPGCHNPQTHDFDGGREMRIAEIDREIGENPLLSGVTFSGGEPFCQAGALAVLGQQVKARGLHLITYTGYIYENLLQMAAERPDIQSLLDLTDLLVDGPYLEAERDLTLLYRGSRNQRLIDLNAMRAAGDMRRILLYAPDDTGW